MAQRLHNSLVRQCGFTCPSQAFEAITGALLDAGADIGFMCGARTFLWTAVEAGSVPMTVRALETGLFDVNAIVERGDWTVGVPTEAARASASLTYSNRDDEFARLERLEEAVRPVTELSLGVENMRSLLTRSSSARWSGGGRLNCRPGSSLLLSSFCAAREWCSPANSF